MTKRLLISEANLLLWSPPETNFNSNLENSFWNTAHFRRSFLRANYLINGINILITTLFFLDADIDISNTHWSLQKYLLGVLHSKLLIVSKRKVSHLKMNHAMFHCTKTAIKYHVTHFENCNVRASFKFVCITFNRAVKPRHDEMRYFLD